MNFSLLFQSSLRAIGHHKGRSFLTILGIIVGIAAIIATLAIGYGTEEKLRKKILARGNNYIELWAGNTFLEGAEAATKRKKTKRLTGEDTLLLKKHCKGIKKISPFMHQRTTITYQKNSIVSTIKAGNQDFIGVINRHIDKGTNFSSFHVQKGSRVIVLGCKAAKELFNTLNPLGHTVVIKNIPYLVIGVTRPIANYFGIRDPNLNVYVPYTTFNKYVSQSSSRFVHGIVASAKSHKVMGGTVRLIRKVLRAKHNLETNDPDDFTVIDQQAMLKAAKESSNIFNLFLLIVASISLIVGGIGVMNIMLVSVTERTQEIGIRMALGAQERIILKQFLIESIVLCSLGGIIGIILGCAAPYGAQYFANFPVVLKINSIIIAAITILLIGVIFGYYPAYKASKLNPVEALTQR